MRRTAGLWASVVCLSLLALGCSASAALPSEGVATPRLRPTPTGPTPSLPIARAVAPTPSVSVSGSPDTHATSAVASGQAFVLRSSALVVGGTIPADYTCDGADQSPPLAWSGAPLGTSAFALVEQDKDLTAAASNQPFTHWLVYNMPSTVTQLLAGQPARPLLTNGSQQGQNSHQTIGYFGPCPVQGDPPHHYSFELFALDGYVTLETGASIDGVQAALTGHILGQAELLVTLKR